MNGTKTTPTRKRPSRTALLEILEARKLLAVSGLPLRVGGNGFDLAKRVLATPDGGFVVAGLFSGKVDFDPGSGVRNRTALGDTDVYLAKYSASAALQWVDQFGSDELDDGLLDQDSIDVAALPIRAGGEFVNGVTADPRTVAEYINDLAIAPDGSIIMAGSFIGSVDFNPGAGKKVFTTYDNDYYDAFVIKINTTSGGLTWADRFGDRFTDTANAIALDTSGNIYVTGLFSRTVSFIKGNANFTFTAEGRADAYAMKLNNKGQVRWVNTFGGDSVRRPDRDAGQDIAVDSNRNVFVGGVFTGDVDFDPSASGRAIVEGRKGTDAALVKYDSNGHFLKVASWTGKGYDGISTVAIDPENDVIVGGYFEGDEFDANPGTAVRTLVATPQEGDNDAEFTDLFVEKLNGSNLGYQWVQQLKGTGTEFADEMKVDGNGNILLGGSFYGTARFGSSGSATSVLGVDDFDDSSDSDRENSYDAFIWKLSKSGATSWVRTVGSVGDDFGGGIDLESDQSILFTGRYRGTTNFGTSSTLKRLRGFGVADGFVTQFDANGLPLFA